MGTGNSLQLQIHIEVAYARHNVCHVIAVQTGKGTTIRQAIEQSGILLQCPEIDLDRHMVGIFSKIKGLDTVLNDGDRVEIYRPLLADPKAARRLRAAKEPG